MTWVIGLGTLIGPLVACGVGYLAGYRDARDKYSPKHGHQ